jgi:hypothetical protein
MINFEAIDYLILAVYFIFVLGIGYWCTGFLVVQRAMAAESMSAARAHAVDCRDPQDALLRAGHRAGGWCAAEPSFLVSHDDLLH